MDIKKSPEKTRKLFLVEHMEEFLYDWCKSEYIQMLKYVQNTDFEVVFSNFDSVLNFKDDGRNGEDNLRNLREFLKLNAETYKNKAFFLGQEIINYFDKEKEAFIFNRGERKNEILKYVNEENIKTLYEKEEPEIIEIPFKRACLLDMRAEKTLEAPDIEEFDVLLFGGILGDHPPRDRTYVLRKHGYGMRNLGKMQMATDTAVLSSKLILCNKLKFGEIAFADEPEIFEKNENGVEQSVIIEGFRYVEDSYDVEKGVFIEEKKGKSKGVTMAAEIKNKLIFEELDIEKFM